MKPSKKVVQKRPIQQNKFVKPISTVKKSRNLLAENWFVVFLFSVATLLAYSNSFTVPMQFDDWYQLLTRDISHSFKAFQRLSFWVNVNERPISFFTFAVNHALHGEEVFGYHLVNLIIHLFSGIILFFWLKLIVDRQNSEPKFNWLPIVITFFFLVHPVQTQSVTYIIQRMSSLAGMFFFLSLYLYTQGRIAYFKEGKRVQSAVLIAGALLSGVLGTLSKQNAVVFPLAMLLVELFFIRTSEGKICKKYLIVSSSIMALGAVAVLVKVGIPSETKDVTPLQYFATQMVVIPQYLQMMLFPVGLYIDHGVKMAVSFFNAKTLVGFAFLLAIAGYAIYMLKKLPMFSFGVFLMFITFLVESSFLPIRDPMFDQRMYLPLAGFAIAIWSLVDYYIFSKKVEWVKPVSVSVLILFSVMTFARNNVWNDKVAIWKGVTEKYPNYIRGWASMGKMMKEDGDPHIHEIIDCFERAREIDPHNEENLINLGFYYMKNNTPEKAAGCYLELQKSNDKSIHLQALRFLAAHYLLRNDKANGVKYANEVFALVPGDEETNNNLCAYYVRQNDFQQLLVDAQKWVAISPNSANALYYTGKAYFELKQRPESKEYFKRTLKIDPNHVEAMMLYANTCVNTFEYDEAIKYLERVYSITKDANIPGHIAMINQLKSQKVGL
jgi:protein O-mannosyl-transferase